MKKIKTSHSQDLIEILIPDHFRNNIDRQKATADHIEKTLELAQSHILSSAFNTDVDAFLPCLKQPTDPDFELPSKEIVKISVDLIIKNGYSKNDISDFIGISRTGSNRLLNYWLNPESDRFINKSNWILLATLAGLMLPLMAQPKDR